MGSSTNTAPAPRKRGMILLLVVFVLVAAAGVTWFLSDDRDTASAPVASVAAPQAEAPAPRVLPRNHIYDEAVDPKADITAALKKAKAEHKRVIVDFGGDWCGDCQVLDLYLHQAPNGALVENNFVVVHVFIDEKMDNHRDIPAEYGVPITKGVPALAVLDAQGKLIHSQTTGEFENMRNMDAGSVTDFLNRWKA